MRNLLSNLLLTVSFLLSLLAAMSPLPAIAASNADLALQWAPIIYPQNNTRTLMTQENVFTVVNYDFDWRPNNNWENLPYYSPKAAVYASLVESSTHYYLGYYLYYPRYASKNPHEQDMVGILAVVQKNTNPQGRLDLLLTYSHNHWHKQDGSQVRFENGHPVLAVSAATHEISTVKTATAGSNLIGIYPLPMIESKQMSVSEAAPRSSYRLVALTELWQRRNDIGQSRTFNRWGYFDSYYYPNVAAPWLWQYNGISWLLKPAELTQYFQRIPAKSETYLYNPYSPK